jgi:hypothetical protein
VGKRTALGEILKMSTGPDSIVETITFLLAEMTREGGFLISMLLDPQGIPFASAEAAGQNPETKEAVLTLVRKAALQVYGRLGPALMDETILYDKLERRLVCRPLSIADTQWILVVLIPEKTMTYRRLMNQAAQAIRRVLGG